MRRVAEALGVSRSQLHERLRKSPQERGRYRKSEDAELLEPVRRLVDERPTYGYRRIGALLNRERATAGLPRLNHKRLYRLMAQNGLLLSDIPVNRLGALTMARSSRSDPTCAGPPMRSKSRVGTDRLCRSFLSWTPAIGR